MRSTAEQVVLEKVGSPKAAVIGLSIVTMVWGTMTGIFGYLILTDSEEFQGIAPKIAFLPFALIGLGLVFGTARAFMKLRNPRREFIAHTERLTPGATFDVTWTFDGRSEAIKSLVIQIVGEEQITFQQGTTMSSSSARFMERTLLTTSDGALIRGGKLSLEIPAGAMHSFSAPHNTITWYLTVKGDIGFWPDLSEQHVIQVRSHRKAIP